MTKSQSLPAHALRLTTYSELEQYVRAFAAGQSAMLAAESTLATSRANYRQVIGVEAVNLTPGSPVDRFTPHTQLKLQYNLKDGDTGARSYGELFAAQCTVRF